MSSSLKICNDLNSSGDHEQRPDLLTPTEIEAYVVALQPSKVQELGSLGWLDKHERIKQLAIQSVIQAMSSKEETVKESLITHEKLVILVHDLILVELWREEILPGIFKELEQRENEGAFVIYPILYHESVIVNLLETILYHSAAVESLGDGSLDLLDYIFRALNSLLTNSNFDDDEEDKDKTNVDIKKQSDSLLFSIACKSLSILRYLIENLESLGNGLMSRLLVSNDTPLLLVELIVQKPWRKEDWREGKIQDYDPASGMWKEIDIAARALIGQIEIQAWLSLYLLLKNNDVLTVYELYSSRQRALFKLLPYFNDATNDQLPLLGELQLFLHQMSVTNVGPQGPSKSPLLLELIPPKRSSLEDEFSSKKKQLFAEAKSELLNCSKELMLEKAKKLAGTYDLESYKGALPPVGKCGHVPCGKEGAEKKCSRCKNIWYCGKECQLGDWKRHRESCN